jgi:hypothetical protein
VRQYNDQSADFSENGRDLTQTQCLIRPFSREDVRPRPQLAGDYQHNIFMAFLFVAGLARAILVAAPSARMVNKECKAERSRIARQQATPST